MHFGNVPLKISIYIPILSLMCTYSQVQPSKIEHRNISIVIFARNFIVCPRSYIDKKPALLYLQYFFHLSSQCLVQFTSEKMRNMLATIRISYLFSIHNPKINTESELILLFCILILWMMQLNNIFLFLIFLLVN